jgi:hypothetical protein
VHYAGGSLKLMEELLALGGGKSGGLMRYQGMHDIADRGHSSLEALLIWGAL